MTVTLKREPHGQTAVVVPPWSESDAHELERSAVVNLRVSGFRNLDFLPDLPRITDLRVVDLGLESDGGATNIHGLRRLQLETYATNPIDFNKVPRLEKLSFHWRSGAESVSTSTALESLKIDGWPRPDAADLGGLHRLRAVRLSNSRRLDSMRGSDAWRELRVLSLRGCPALEDISGVAGLAESIIEVEIQACRRLCDVSALAGLTGIKRLSLIDCGHISSLDVVQHLTALEEFYFYGTTSVDDGDLTPILGLSSLRHLAFAPRRHYSHRPEEVARLRGLKETSPHLPRWDW